MKQVDRMRSKIKELQDARNAMSMRLMDTCAILAAIDAMLANSITSIQGEDGRRDNTIHTLACLALEKAREADSLSDDLEPMLNGLRLDA